MLVKIYGSAVFGVEATTITIEVNIDKGVGYHLVGLPDIAIKESNFLRENIQRSFKTWINGSHMHPMNTA